MDRDYFGNKSKKGKYDSFGYSDPFQRRGYFTSRVGASTLLKREALGEVKSKIRAGAKNVEIVLSGIGKPSKARGNYPAGAYGAARRRDIKNLLEVNKVRRSVHFSPGHSLVTLDKEGNFSRRRHKKVKGELKRTVEFAHDVGGENVVVHTSMTERPFPTGEEEEWKPFKGEKARERLGKRGRIYKFIDKETGKGYPLPDTTRVPMYQKNGKYVPVGAEEEKIPDDAKLEMVQVRDAVEKHGINPETLLESTWIAKQQKEVEAEKSRYERIKRTAKKRLEALRSGKKLLEERPGRTRKVFEGLKGTLGANAPTTLREVKKEIRNEKDRLRWAENALTRYETQDLELEAREESIKKADDFLKKQAIEDVRDLAWKSYQEYEDTGKKVAITPENMHPEALGSHPEELATLIRESRGKFANKLQEEEDISRQKAERLAEDFIGATFDIAHANLWQKYYEGDKEEFNKWLEEKTEKLAEQEIAKEIHISDNFGYEDTHLAVGEGNVPNKEIIEKLEKKGIPIKAIVEPGAPGTLEKSEHLYRAHAHLGTKMYPGGPSYGEAMKPTYGRGFYSRTVGRVRVGKSKETWSGVPI